MQGSRVQPKTSVVNTVIRTIAPNKILLRSRYHGGVLFDRLRARAVLSPWLVIKTCQSVLTLLNPCCTYLCVIVFFLKLSKLLRLD